MARRGQEQVAEQEGGNHAVIEKQLTADYSGTPLSRVLTPGASIEVTPRFAYLATLYASELHQYLTHSYSL